MIYFPVVIWQDSNPSSNFAHNLQSFNRYLTVKKFYAFGYIGMSVSGEFIQIRLSKSFVFSH